MKRLGIGALALTLAATMGCKVTVGPADGSGGAGGVQGFGQGAGAGPGAGGGAQAGQTGGGQAGQTGGGQTGGGQAGQTGGGQAGEAGSGQAGGGAAGGGQAGAGGQQLPQDPFPALDGSLAQTTSCTDLEAALKKDASARMNARVDAQVAALKGSFAGQGGQGGDTGSNDSYEAKYDFTKTNLQTQGVDEADIVKADAEFIYVLHGNVFGIVDVDPPEQMKFLNSTEIEGYPVEMFVSNGYAIVYSIVNGDPIYKAAGVTPKPRLSNEYGWGNFIPPDDIKPDTLLTKATVIEMPEASIKVTSEQYFEGAYLSSRRVDGSVRTIIRGGAHGPALQSYPDAETVDGWEKLRKDNQAKIDASQASDWQPYRFIKSGGKVTASVAPCEEYYVPAEGSTEYGLVQLQTFNWETPNDIKSASIAADAKVVYGSAGAVYVAATATEDPYYSYYYGNQKTPTKGTRQSYAHTYLHKFSLTSGAAPVYAGTGSVNGQILNQFSLDEYNGDLRVAVHDERWLWDGDGTDVYPVPDPSNHVYVLRPDASAKKLNVIGSVLDIKEKETLRSSRFVEDRGYVVTFEEIDPLFVLDLSKPEAPKVLGSVEVPGFSEYMHPLGKTHLLTIGKQTEGPTGSVRIVGMQLQIFDVTDGTKPKQVHAFEYKIENGEVYSEAENNHKAFLYHPDKKILTFPLSSSNYDGNYSVRSSLEVFSVDTATGFSPLGSISHDDLFKASTLKYCIDQNFPALMRRGIFRGDILYSVSYAGILANNVNTLGTIAGSMPLQTPSAFNFQCAPP